MRMLFKFERIRIGLCCGLLALFLSLTPVPIHAQEQPPEETAATDTETPVPQPTEVVDLSSPRATVQAFLTAMNAVNAGTEDQWPTALACVYTEGLGEEEARDLAGRIFDALSTFTVDLESIPQESAEDTFTLALSDEVSIDLLRNNDGRWRFSKDSIEDQAAELEEAVEQEEVKQADAIDERVDPRVATPRATIQTFLDAFVKGESAVAEDSVFTLDLNEVDKNVRQTKGEEFAYRLYEILTRDEQIFPQDPKFNKEPGDTAPVTLLRDPNNRSRKIVLQAIEVASDAEADEEASEVEDAEPIYEWKFSKRTLDSLDAMWEETYKARTQQWGVFGGSRPMALVIRDYMSESFPFLLDDTVYLENWQWLGLLLIVFLGFVISRFAAFLLAMIIRRVFNKEHAQLDNKLESDFVKPIRIAIMAWVWWLALAPLGLPENILSVLKSVVTTISALSAVWAVYRLVDILGKFIAEKAKLTATKYDDMVVPLIVRTLKVFVILVGIVFVAEVNEYDSTKLLAGLGIGGLAFALAAQDTVSNLFGSLTLLFDRPFQIGDWIQIGDVDGNVEAVGMRSTRVRTFYNSVITIPNSQLTTATIDNYGARRYRRFKTDIGVQYDTTPEQIEAFCEGIRELIRRHPYTRKDYYHVYLNTFGDSTLNILLYCFHECPEWSTELRERERLMLDIMKLARELGVQFAFPTQTLHMFKEEAAAEVSLEGESLGEGIKKARAVMDARSGTHFDKPPPVRINFPKPLQQGTDDEDGS